MILFYSEHDCGQILSPVIASIEDQASPVADPFARFQNCRQSDIESVSVCTAILQVVAPVHSCCCPGWFPFPSFCFHFLSPEDSVSFVLVCCTTWVNSCAS